MARHTLASSSSRDCALRLACDLSLSSTAQTTERSPERQTTKSKCLAAIRLSAPCRAELPRPDFTAATSATRTLPKTLCSGPTAWSKTPRNERSAAEKSGLPSWYGKPMVPDLPVLPFLSAARTTKTASTRMNSQIHDMQRAPLWHLTPELSRPAREGWVLAEAAKRARLE